MPLLTLKVMWQDRLAQASEISQFMPPGLCAVVYVLFFFKCIKDMYDLHSGASVQGIEIVKIYNEQFLWFHS